MKAVIYARYSSDNQREESIEAQTRAIKEYAERNNYQIVKIYADEARSATTDDRPQFLQLIKDCEMGLFEAVIVHKLDRFARNRYDSAFYKRELQKNGVRLISVLEHLDNSPESVILESVLEGMAEYYSKNLAREVMKGMKETALQAKHNGGIAPLGFDVTEDKTYVINENEAIIIKRIFNLYNQGFGYRIIADTLNTEGHKTKIGNAFSKNSIYDILNNEKYKGTYVFNKRSSKIAGKRNNRRNKDEDSIIKIPNAMPAIIDEAIFNNAQNKIKSQIQGPRMTAKRYYLLTGYMYCGECNGTYTGNGCSSGRGGKRYPQYSCTTRERTKGCMNKAIRQSVIEDFVIQELQSQVFSKSAIKGIVKEIITYAKDHGKESTKEINYINEKLKDVNSKMEKLLDALEDGILDRETIKNRMSKYKQEKAALEIRLQEINITSYDWLDEEKISSFILKSKEDLLSDDNSLKRRVIETFVHKIKVYPDRVDLTFKVNMISSPNMDRDMYGGGGLHLTLPLSIDKKELYGA